MMAGVALFSNFINAITYNETSPSNNDKDTKNKQEELDNYRKKYKFSGKICFILDNVMTKYKNTNIKDE